MLAYLTHHPWRIPRLALALPAAACYLLDRDRGALKGRFIRATLGGASRASLQACAERFVRRIVPRGMHAAALQAIERHRAAGDRLLLLSASTDLYVPQLAAALGFDAFICTRVRWGSDDRLDGRLASVNCRAEEKRHQLAAVIARDAPDSVYAYGNSASDLPHMQLAQQSYLINARWYRRLRLAPSVQPLRWR